MSSSFLRDFYRRYYGKEMLQRALCLLTVHRKKPYNRITDDLYLHPRFKEYFDTHSGMAMDGLYSTVTLRQIMWALKMKPIKRERWETVFDRRNI